MPFEAAPDDVDFELLATYLNLRIINTPLRPQNDPERRLSRILDGPGTLEKKVGALAPLLRDRAFFRAFRFRCVEHPQSADEYHLGQVLGS